MYSINNRTKNGKNVEKAIIDIIKSSDTPVSTNELSKKTNKAWHTINSHCLQLQIENRISCMKLGNNTLWAIKNE